MYNIYVNNQLVKSYKYEIQAVTYCFMKGYISSGGYDFYNGWYYFLDERVKIERN